MVALIGLWLSTASAADCAAPVTHPALTRQVNAAMDAFYALDSEAFRAARAEISAMAPCLDEPVHRRVMAELHRVEALNAFLDRDEATTKAHFAAAAVIDPSYDARELAPEGHPILALEAASRAEATAPAAPIPVGDGLAWWDGAAPAQRVGELPGLLQTADRYGVVEAAEWVSPGAAPQLAAAPQTNVLRVSLRADRARAFGHQAYAGEVARSGTLGIGVVRPTGGFGGTLGMHLQNGVPWYDQLDWPERAVGDVAWILLGANAWRSVPVGPVELAPEARFGLVHARSNVDDNWFQVDVVEAGWDGWSDYIRPKTYGVYAGGALRVAKATPNGRVRLVAAPGVDVLWVGEPIVVARAGVGFDHDF